MRTRGADGAPRLTTREAPSRPSQAAAAPEAPEARRCPCPPRLEELQQAEWRLEEEELRIHEDVMQLRAQIQAVQVRVAVLSRPERVTHGIPLI